LILVTALMADADGVEGVGNHAGALVDGGTVARLRAAGFDARKLLAENDSHSGFEAIGDLLVTGPTSASVNDVRAILID
jgi:hydroxypyruvate reductase